MKQQKNFGLGKDTFHIPIKIKILFLKTRKYLLNLKQNLVEKNDSLNWKIYYCDTSIRRE